MRMKQLQQEYRQARQELETKLQHAVRSHEVDHTLSLQMDHHPMMPSNVSYTTAPSVGDNNGHPELPPDYMPPMTVQSTLQQPQALHYAAVLPGGSRYQIHVNPDGSQQVIHLPQTSTSTLT